MEGFVGLDCEDPDFFDFATNEDIWQKADDLTAAWHTETSWPRFRELERTAG